MVIHKVTFFTPDGVKSREFDNPEDAEAFSLDIKKTFSPGGGPGGKV